jgi:predicted ATPase/class 3 adenylate cyclase/GAF domain-containing protein
MAESKNILLRENPVHLIYLKQTGQGNKPVILKQLNAPFPSDDLVAQLKNEFITTRQLDIPGLRKAIRFNEGEGNYFLELEYVEGQNLREFAAATPENILTLLEIVSKLCQTLGQLHHAGWIHSSLCSTNIIIHPVTKEPTIIDASLMTRFSIKASGRISAEKLRSILPYISPEQTGRTNRALDHRTDFYSLGITLYEILTGSRPFNSNDSLELIYAHLARLPVEPHKINHAIPKILSEIILKLLAKNAEDRYQSALGLKYDLDRVIKNWDSGLEYTFILGEKDFSGKLQIPQKLYGREPANIMLLDNLRLTHKGDRRAVIISGESGTGKSAIVQEVRKPITENKGFFLQGKFDQFAKNIPYSAWIEIFKDFINQLLTTDEAEIHKWRTLLTKTLGNSTGVLTGLIPNLQFIIHELPSAEELGITETQNRLNDLLNRFFKSISTEEHPITIFLDDLQWADNASLNLLKNLITDADCKYLLLIGAFRSDELEQTNPLIMKLEEIERSGVYLSTTELGNLDTGLINELISDTLSAEPALTSKLAEEVFHKTQGNPYFTYQFINTLYEEGLLKFSWDKSLEEKKPVWEWDLPRIRSMFISSNVVELLVDKIAVMPEAVIETLKSAACIGNSFMLKTLSTVRKADINAISDMLDLAINEGYVFYKNVNQIHWVREGMDVEYQFAHDKVQQVFYSLIPENERQQTHFDIGKLLFASLKSDQIDDQIFQLVFHLNFGIDLVSDYQQAKWLARLNFNASQAAKKIIAYDAAYNYLSIAQQLVGENIWKDDGDLALELGLEFLDCAYQTNRFEEAELYFDSLLTRIPDNVKKAELHYRKMIQYQHLSKIDNILDIGLKGLNLLGLKFSPKSSPLIVFIELIKSYFLIKGKTEEELIHLPEMKDPASRMAMALIYKSLTFAYDRSEELMAVLGMKLLQLTLKKGKHDFSIGGYSTYGGILSIGFNNQQAPLTYNRIAVASSHYLGNKAAMSMAHFGLAMTAYAKLPFKEALEEFQTSVDLAMEVGAHTDAAPSTMYFFFLNFIQGKRLNELRQIVLDNLYFTAQIKTDNFHLILLAGLSVIQELKDGPDKPLTSIKGIEISAAELEEKLMLTEHKSIRVYSRIFQMYNHILFEGYDRARACEREVLDVLNVTLGTVLGPYFNYLQAVLYGRLFFTAPPKEKSRIRKLINRISKQIEKLALNCPSNFQHWDFLLKAEAAKVNGQYNEAQKWYDKAIEVAKARNYVHEAALGNYLCAALNQAIGHARIAEYYLIEAAHGFNAWGAESLAEFISSNLKSTPGTITGIGSARHTSLDQESLIKLSQLISGEIDFNKLIKKLMTLFIENAGAEKAVLIMKNNNRWFIEAEQQKNEEVRMIHSVLLDETEIANETSIVPTNICQYVMRTRETVIIEEATQNEQFSKSPYIKINSPRSILCTPLIKNGELTGLVYLENNVMAGSFKTDRVQLLNYISSQIAVSIDNAKLYSDLKKLTSSYERFVPKEFLKMLGKDSIIDVKLGDQVQMNMTVLFADIRNFTGMSEKLNPAENFEFINEYLSRMEPIIRKYHGFIDKYIGDEIMALFPTNADDAIQCGIAMLRELKAYSDLLYANKRRLEPLQIGIGLNTGSLMLGTVGGEDRMNSTVISDVVNLASRVEKDTKISGAPFIITKETYDNLKNPSQYAIRKLSQKRYRGKSSVTTVYEVFDSDDPAVLKLKKESIANFEMAVANYEKQKYREALALFNTILEKNPADKPTSIYQQNINHQLKTNIQYSEDPDISSH